MSVFISWSGERSKLVASAFRELISTVIQKSEPWMSDEDIEPGAQWRSRVRSHLDNADAGVICLTPDNLTAPWLLFEAGALSMAIKGDDNHVFTYLYQLEPSDITDPLAQYQGTSCEEVPTLDLLQAINKTLPSEKQTPPEIIARTFGKFWGEYQQKLNAVVPLDPQEATPRRTVEDMVEELVVSVRNLPSRLLERLEETQSYSDMVSTPRVRTRSGSLEPSIGQPTATRATTLNELFHELQARAALLRNDNLKNRKDPDLTTSDEQKDSVETSSSQS